MSKLTLYHGSNRLFDAVDLSCAKDKRDFGKGFYLTFRREHAEQWACAMRARYGGEPYVYEFELDLSEELAVKTLDGLSEEWLELIKKGRIEGGVPHSYDAVIGPLTDDSTMRTAALFIAGVYTEEIALQQLKFYEADNQISLHTDRAVSRLILMRRDAYGK